MFPPIQNLDFPGLYHSKQVMYGWYLGAKLPNDRRPISDVYYALNDRWWNMQTRTQNQFTV